MTKTADDDAAEALAEREFWDAATPLHVWGTNPAEGLEASLSAIHAGLDLCIDAESPRVLEIGCGLGRLLVPLARAHPTWTLYGLDISSVLLSQCRTLVANYPNVTLLHSDGRTIPAADMFDAIYSMVVFQHISRPATAHYLTESFDLLRLGGIIRFQFVEGTEDTFLNRHWQSPEMIAVLRQIGYEVIGYHHGLIEPNWTWITARRP